MIVDVPHWVMLLLPNLGLFAVVTARALRELVQQEPGWDFRRFWTKRYAT